MLWLAFRFALVAKSLSAHSALFSCLAVYFKIYIYDHLLSLYPGLSLFPSACSFKVLALAPCALDWFNVAVDRVHLPQYVYLL